MRKLLTVALLAAFAPLGIAHAASPKPTPAKAAPIMPMKGKTLAKKKPTKKSHLKTVALKKTSTKKTTTHAKKTTTHAKMGHSVKSSTPTKK